MHHGMRSYTGICFRHGNCVLLWDSSTSTCFVITPNILCPTQPPLKTFTPVLRVRPQGSNSFSCCTRSQGSVMPACLRQIARRSCLLSQAGAADRNGLTECSSALLRTMTGSLSPVPCPDVCACQAACLWLTLSPLGSKYQRGLSLSGRLLTM